ncbi:hypothetical protein SDRG_12562 [Saprolegnia diclina VS20]|uniref:Major facilitator superfamily (MFS) profile domain-containing protein n=1 Tax=Saprolegnia diclina (strain VS20) TaxID=1156394 RepID=T0Q5A1_SAPDV|nr:hypothetical protein SDRG_12562 [Saprolegnia diclina VS20]EQC29791.1 hypothetical protein SDRG_12562 [Saprolegnia diclina VS20]|eukprot:XP_008616857.1 hypothetical protein SDRG_12562 [Saprolegnia diclina VS20]
MNKTTDVVATPTADYAMEGGLKYAGKANSFAQILLLGLICFGCPGMFNALNGLGGGGQVDDKVSSNANVALYACFAGFSVFAGSVHNFLGPRLTLFVGGCTYALYAGSLLSYNYTQNGTFVIVAGAILGIGAGLLWTAQGTMMLAYPTENEKGKFISIFWVVFNLGGVLGGFIPFGFNYNSTASSVNNATYIGFICAMAIGTSLALALKAPSTVIRSDGTQVEYPKAASAMIEIRGLYAAIFDWRMLCLIPASSTR